MNTGYGAQAYAQTGKETSVLKASPEQLIVLLYEGAISAIKRAKLQMQLDNIQGKGEEISKALRIIEEGLRAALNPEAGGEIAQELDRLYDYVVRTLVNANVNNDVKSLESAENVLSDLVDAWREIRPEKVA